MNKNTSDENDGHVNYTAEVPNNFIRITDKHMKTMIIFSTFTKLIQLKWDCIQSIYVSNCINSQSR